METPAKIIGVKPEIIRTCPKYTEEETMMVIVLRNKPRKATVAAVRRRSASSVRYKRRDLRRAGRMPAFDKDADETHDYWDDDEITYLLQHRHAPAATIALGLERRTVQAVKTKLRDLRRKGLVPSIHQHI